MEKYRSYFYVYSLSRATVVAFTINSIRRSNKVQKELDVSNDEFYEKAMKALNDIDKMLDIKKMN